MPSISFDSVVDPYCPVGTPLIGSRGASDFSQFDLVHDRRGTASLKWDFTAQRGRPEGVLPLWVADMDHQTAPGVTSTLLWRVRHGIFGYSDPDGAYDAALSGWFARRYDWEIDPGWNVVTPGVVPALALAVRAYTEPGDAVVSHELGEDVGVEREEVGGALGVRQVPLVEQRRGVAEDEGPGEGGR